MPAPITNGESGSSARTKINTAFTELATAQSDITARQLTSEKGQANGYAGLDGSGKVPSAQLPSFVDDVLEFANFAALPGTGEAGKIYVLGTPYTSGGVTSSQFRWSGSAYAPIVASPGTTDAVTEGSTNQYFTAARVRGALLTGLTAVTAAAIAATDSVLQAFQKLQAQIDAKLDADLATDVDAAVADPAENDQVLWTLTGSGDSPVLGPISRLRKRLATESIGTSLGTTGTVNLDFAALVGTKQRITATGNITFTGSNYADGQTFQVRVDANGATRTLAYPANWKRIGSALPTSLASGEILLLAFSSNGITEASIDVAGAKSV